MSQPLALDDLAARFRDQMPVCRRWVYFDHAAVAPLPAPTNRAIQTWLAEATNDGDVVWPRWADRIEQIRCDFATLVQADSAEIALVPNTTAGINLVAEGFPWQAGDNIVTLANEFPSNLYPWMNLAVRRSRNAAWLPWMGEWSICNESRTYATAGLAS